MSKSAKERGAAKAATTMREFSRGQLRSGSPTGPKVTDPNQAKAIAMSQARAAKGGTRKH